MHPKHAEFLERIAHQEQLVRRMLDEQKAALAGAREHAVDEVDALQTLISMNEQLLALIQTSRAQLDGLDDERWDLIAGIKPPPRTEGS